MPPRAILTDIEGTTTPISFVRDVLFPYARARLPAFLAAHATTHAVAPLLAEVARLNPQAPPLATLLAWMDQDAKITPLKTLQGLIWRSGYEAGDIKGALYPDVAPALARWHAADIALFVYSSGSIAAQRLLFGHSQAGNLLPLFSGFHDTTTGAKQSPASYAAIAAAANIPPEHWLFLSDSAAELDAARAAGLTTCQLVRAEDATKPTPAHPNAPGFTEVDRLWAASTPV